MVVDDNSLHGPSDLSWSEGRWALCLVLHCLRNRRFVIVLISVIVNRFLLFLAAAIL